MFCKNVPLVNRYHSTVLRRCESIWAGVKPKPLDMDNVDRKNVFKAAKHPKKINLVDSTFLDVTGRPYLFESILKAERQLVSRYADNESRYRGGTPEFCNLTAKFALGEDSHHVDNQLTATVQSLSGSGALALASQFLHLYYPGVKKVYLPNPTWVSHKDILSFGGMEIGYYKYLNPEVYAVDFKALVEDVSNIPKDSIILLQGCAHNPSGVDLTNSQWDDLSVIVKEKNMLPIFDMVYQGFASGDFNLDAYCVRKFVGDGNYLIVCQTFSKNMGLYGERVGALTVLTGSKEEAVHVKAHLKYLIQAFYKHPPNYGARIVSTVLKNPALKANWCHDFKVMVERFDMVRQKLVTSLQTVGSRRDWFHIGPDHQKGMYSYLGLTDEQVIQLADEFGIYLGKAGRLSLAGVHPHNIDYIVDALHRVAK